MSQETRPVLFITYSLPDPDDAMVFDVSESLEGSRHEAKIARRGGYVYRVERQQDGTYGNEQFIERLVKR